MYKEHYLPNLIVFFLQPSIIGVTIPILSSREFRFKDVKYVIKKK